MLGMDPTQLKLQWELSVKPCRQLTGFSRNTTAAKDPARLPIQALRGIFKSSSSVGSCFLLQNATHTESPDALIGCTIPHQFFSCLPNQMLLPPLCALSQPSLSGKVAVKGLSNDSYLNISLAVQRSLFCIPWHFCCFVFWQKAPRASGNKYW